MWIMRRAAIVAFLLILLPIVMFLAGTALPGLSGCLPEVGDVPCRPMGIDTSWVASNLLISSVIVFALFTVPAALTLAAWLIAEIVNAFTANTFD